MVQDPCCASWLGDDEAARVLPALSVETMAVADSVEDG